jgi:hypothetical protein
LQFHTQSYHIHTIIIHNNKKKNWEEAIGGKKKRRAEIRCAVAVVAPPGAWQGEPGVPRVRVRTGLPSIRLRVRPTAKAEREPTRDDERGTISIGLHGWRAPCPPLRRIESTSFKASEARSPSHLSRTAPIRILFSSPQSLYLDWIWKLLQLSRPRTPTPHLVSAVRVSRRRAGRARRRRKRPTAGGASAWSSPTDQEEDLGRGEDLAAGAVRPSSRDC